MNTTQMYIICDTFTMRSILSWSKSIIIASTGNAVMDYQTMKSLLYSFDAMEAEEATEETDETAWLYMHI